jgi:hypothetical protein
MERRSFIKKLVLSTTAVIVAGPVIKDLLKEPVVLYDYRDILRRYPLAYYDAIFMVSTRRFPLTDRLQWEQI